MGSRRIRGPLVVDNVTVFTGVGNYTVVNESSLVVKKASGAATGVVLPSNGGVNRGVFVTDGKGDAATNNITVTVAGGGTINGATSFVMSGNYQSVFFLWNGSEYNVYANYGSNSGVAGAANTVVRMVRGLTAMVDNTATLLATITVPNILLGGSVTVGIVGMLGDGDASDYGLYNIAVARIAGANATGAISAKVGAAATTGVTANSATVVTIGAVAGAVGATNTFAINAKVTKSAGSSANHLCTAEIIVNNVVAGGITVS